MRSDPACESFSKPLSEEEMLRKSKGFTPANTTKNTDWALKVFREWQEQRDHCPKELLVNLSVKELNPLIPKLVYSMLFSPFRT